jgi:hypothetical protein
MTTEEAAAYALTDALGSDELEELVAEMEDTKSTVLKKIAGHITDIESRN